MRAEAKLVRKGRDVSLEGLLEQGRVHYQLQEEHAERLRRCGWTAQHGRELLEAIEKVEIARAEAIEARLTSKKNLERVKAAQARVRRFKRRFVLALNDLRAARRIELAAWRAMKESGPLHRSTPRMLHYLTSIVSLVERYDPLIAPYFGGESALAELLAVSEELEAAQRKQKADRAGLPSKTRKVYLAKARLLGLIDKLNRIARIAFADDENTQRLFGKKLIERATKPRRKRAKPVSQSLTPALDVDERSAPAPKSGASRGEAESGGRLGGGEHESPLSERAR